MPPSPVAPPAPPMPGVYSTPTISQQSKGIVDAYDRNGDGAISYKHGEATRSTDMGGMSLRSSIELLAGAADRIGNNDGQATRKEIAGVMSLFDDAPRDGRLLYGEASGFQMAFGPETTIDPSKPYIPPPHHGGPTPPFAPMLPTPPFAPMLPTPPFAPMPHPMPPGGGPMPMPTPMPPPAPIAPLPAPHPMPLPGSGPMPMPMPMPLPAPHPPHSGFGPVAPPAPPTSPSMQRLLDALQAQMQATMSHSNNSDLPPGRRIP